LGADSGALGSTTERRLGKPLLKAHFFLAVFGFLVVAVSVVVMHS
jgi:hypothetical protein